MALCLVVLQESFRLELRTRRRELPIPHSLQNFYYYNFGDFSNGFVDAFLIDGLADTLLLPVLNRRLRRSNPLLAPHVRAVTAALLSALIIVIFETRQNAVTQSDLADIPAGIAGAFAYLAVRTLALALRKQSL